MTGKELIIYILQNNLENEEILKDGRFIGFITEEEAAVKFDVGLGTIRAWYMMGYIKGTMDGDKLFLFSNIKDPRYP